MIVVASTALSLAAVVLCVHAAPPPLSTLVKSNVAGDPCDLLLGRTFNTSGLAWTSFGSMLDPQSCTCAMSNSSLRARVGPDGSVIVTGGYVAHDCAAELSNGDDWACGGWRSDFHATCSNGSMTYTGGVCPQSGAGWITNTTILNCTCPASAPCMDVLSRESCFPLQPNGRCRDVDADPNSFERVDCRACDAAVLLVCVEGTPWPIGSFTIFLNPRK